MDSLGEFLALGVSLEDLGQKTSNDKVLVLASALDEAIASILNEDKSPSRRVNELDNRGSHFYLSLYWARALASQEKDLQLRERFEPISNQLSELENVIIEEMNASQGIAVDIGGYYQPNPELVSKAMRPSQSFNGVIDSLA